MPLRHYKTIRQPLRLTLIASFVCALPLLFEAHTRTGATAADHTFLLGTADTNSLYAITIALKDPSQVQRQATFQIAIADSKGLIAEKTLHAQDLDFYLTLHPRAAGQVTATLRSASSDIPALTTAFHRISQSKTASAVIAAMPNDTWQSAQPIEFGQTVFGGSDERPYAPAPGEDRYAALIKGFQWFKFTYKEPQPQLVYFVLDITDREVPLDVDIFTPNKDQSAILPYNNGSFVYQIEATQNYPGLYKFRTRILHPGDTYYVRIDANHPAYQLHTFSYPVPPYTDPRQAVRTGMDFLINMGDSWLSNTPRRGAIALRTTMNHGDTQQCIACHPTQFTTRGYLTAVSHGYAPTQRPALEFLTDRIYNNQRPLYGEPGTDWVRVIYTARTVASRLPLLEHLYEANVTHDPPRLASFEIPFANYLKIHYKDRTVLPGDEPDGCEPDVSSFEIASQSWDTFDLLYQQTHEKQWLDQRNMVLNLALPSEPKNMIDLNWKIHFLATVDRHQYTSQLEQLIEKLYSYEQPNGMWAYAFDKNGKPSDFISYHAILALALAGHRPESDPRLQRAVNAMLQAQRPEGSWEGDPVYQGFNTPFRATQFAVMALSTLYPGSNQKPSAEKRWNDAFPEPPANLTTNNLSLLLSQLDQFWDLAPAPTLEQIRNVLSRNDQPLAREAAARALGHMADPQSIESLIAALADPNKMVQRTSGWALRMILERRPAAATHGRAQLMLALSSANARTRWGATEFFNQHFKYVAQDDALRQALIHDLSDPAAGVRVNAARGLWQWSYWSSDNPKARNAILEALATQMSSERDPTARRAVHEAIYDVLDENTGYLEAWINAAGTSPDQALIRQGYEAVVHDQAQVLAKVLRSATPLGRRGILDSLWDFHIRHYSLPKLKEGQVSVALPAVFTKYVSGVPDLHVPGYEYQPYRDTADFDYDVHNGFFQTRVGNDSELIHFYKSSGPELEEALIQCLDGAESDLKIDVLKAGSTLSAAGDAHFAAVALNLALDPDRQVRDAVNYVYENGQRGSLNIDTAAARPDTSLIRTITNILNSGSDDTQRLVLPLLAVLPESSSWTHQQEVVTALRRLLDQQPRNKNYSYALTASAAFPDLMNDPAVQKQMLDAINDANRDVQRAAIQIALNRLQDAHQSALSNEIFAHLGSSQRTVFMEEVSDPRFLRRLGGIAGGALSQDGGAYANGKKPANPTVKLLIEPAVLNAVLDSLTDSEANVRAAALDLLRKSPEIEERSEFRAAMDRMQNDPNIRLKLIAKNVLAGKKLGEALQDVKPGSVLDFNYFVAKVEPILATTGADGKACVMCHASHVIFRLQPPNAEGQFAQQDSEENYKYAMRVVDINDPEHSLMLIKPTRPTDSAGNVSDYLATHNGGQRWPGNQSSWQYETILQWIRGANLQAKSPQLNTAADRSAR